MAQTTRLTPTSPARSRAREWRRASSEPPYGSFQIFTHGLSIGTRTQSFYVLSSTTVKTIQLSWLQRRPGRLRCFGGKPWTRRSGVCGVLAHIRELTVSAARCHHKRRLCCGCTGRGCSCTRKLDLGNFSRAACRGQWDVVTRLIAERTWPQQLARSAMQTS